MPKASGKYLLSFNGASVLSSRNSNVENQVIDKIILEEKIVYYLEKIVQSFNKLNEEERKYIYLKYFIDKKLSDEEIQKKCYMSLRTYRNLKKSAQIKFAIALGVEMYDE